jgi:hypothetical protein
MRTGFPTAGRVRVRERRRPRPAVENPTPSGHQWDPVTQARIIDADRTR